MVTGMILGASFSQIFPIMIVLLTTASICISLGMILGSLCSLNQISGIGSILITGIGFFSNIWMDLRMVGGIFEKIGYMLPFAHAVDAVKALASGNNFSTIAGHFFVVLTYAIVFT
jgi:ABC-2 type transport system permease protein